MNNQPSPEKMEARARAAIFKEMQEAGILAALTQKNKEYFAYTGESRIDNFVDFKGERYRVVFASKQAFLVQTQDDLAV